MCIYYGFDLMKALLYVDLFRQCCARDKCR
jgi:hypothetical protein